MPDFDNVYLDSSISIYFEIKYNNKSLGSCSFKKKLTNEVL